MTPPRPPASGFTLIEVIAVLVLIGALIAFTPLALDSLVAERELEREAVQLGNLLEALAAQAVLDRADHAMHYDTENGRWAMQLPEEVEASRTQRRRRDGKEERERPKVRTLDDDVTEDELDWHALPRGISLRFFQGNRFLTGRYRVVFGWRGTTDPHILVFESANVSSLDDADRARTVKVNFLGFPSFSPGVNVEEMRRSDVEVR